MAGFAGFLTTAWYRADPWLWLLRPLEGVYRLAVSLRAWLYRRGIFRTVHPDRPVVVVGNITAGGTGKTPVVIALVDALKSRGLMAGVVSRGYGASGHDFPHVLGKDSTVRDCGDESLLIHRRTGAPCVVSPSRVEACLALLERYPVDLVISDDGLQHYALGRSLEIALYDARLGFGNGFCLPAGPLRESRRRLDTVDFALARGSQAVAGDVFYEADCLVNLNDSRKLPANPDELGTDVYAVAGIGEPGQFADMLRGLGFNPEQVNFRDHHDYQPGDFVGLVGKPIIMTEKDAVKCATFAGNNSWYLCIHAQVPEALIKAVVALAKQ
jgi:tetraacyldisaccharide 4'-kinase